MIGRSMLKVDDEVVARLARGLGEQVAASSFAPR
jgi:hypothetical protein